MDRDVRVLVGLGVVVAILLAVLVIVIATGDDGDGVLVLQSDTAATAAESTSTEEAVGEEPATTSTQPTTTTQPAAATTTTQPATTTTTRPATTTTPTTTTTTQPERRGPCAGEEPARPLPANALEQTLTVADLDGEGTDETMRVYRDGDLGHWFIRVELANGWAGEMVLDANVGRVVGVVSFGSDRVVMVQNREYGDGQVGYGFFVFYDCRIRSASDAVGDQLAVPVGERWVGGNLVAVDGLRCTEEGFSHTKARPSQSGPYEWVVSSLTYTWDRASRTLRPASMEVSIAFCCNRPDDDDLIFGAGVLAC